MNFEDNDFISQNLSNICSVSGTVLIYMYSFDELIYQLPEIGTIIILILQMRKQRQKVAH